MAETPLQDGRLTKLLNADLLPAVIALAITAAMIGTAAFDQLNWSLAMVLSSLSWAAAAGVLAKRLRSRERRLSHERQRLQSLEEIQVQYGVAENLGAFGTWLIDRGSARLIWSEGAFRLFGAQGARTEPSVHEFIAGIHVDDRPGWMQAHRRALKHGGEVRIEYRYLVPGREIAWIRSIGRAERDETGAVARIGGVAQDITSIRAMQQQLAASEAKFRDLTHMSSDWVWETDAGHHWCYFSESTDAVLGRWSRALLGHAPWDGSLARFVFAPADWRAQRATMNAHSPFEDFEYAVVDPSGDVHFLSISGRAVFDAGGQFRGYRGVGREITREKEQRLLLRIENEIAAVMREHSEPGRVITGTLGRVCEALAWRGGASLGLDTEHGTFSVYERFGDSGFVRMLDALPARTPLSELGGQSRAWRRGEPVWIENLDDEPALAALLQASSQGLRAALLAPVPDETGAISSMLLFGSDVGFRGDEFVGRVAATLSRNLSLYLQRKAAERRLTHQSRHDALTGLPNRAHLTEQLEELLDQGQPAAVMYIDLDRFKLINDTLGHQVGDQVLIEVAGRLRESIRPEDLAGRIGGDEFILLLRGLNDRAQIEQIGRRTLAAIEKPFVLGNRAYFLSASIGVAVSPDDGTDARVLMKCADSAMYGVKSDGRNDVRFFAGGMGEARTGQMQLAAELPQAMKRDEIDLFYQPVLDVARRTVVGFEALLRWRHPVRGLLTADQFLPMAEQSNLIREAGMWAIRRALEDRAALGLDRYDGAAVSVNVSARQFSDETFLEDITRLLSERGVPARLLRLELTESAFIENPERTAALIADLRRLGVRVIIDNFGTGYSSLSYLKNLPVDGVKIDQVFIRNLPQDQGNAAIVEAITTLATRLGMQAMAEGVETAAELHALRGFACDQVQGTLICEPVPFGELQEFLEAIPQVRRMHLVETGDKVA